MGSMFGASPVCLVDLVSLVHLVYPVSLVQPNKQDKPNKRRFQVPSATGE